MNGADKRLAAGGGVIHHVAFVELLSQLEREGAEEEWRETWAGLLVIRLYGLWHLKPEAAHGDSPGAISVRALVDDLPEATFARQALGTILDTLRTSGTTHAAVVS